MTEPAPRDDDRLYAMLSDYVDGTLTAGERAEVEAALAADPALRAEVDELRGSMALLKSLPPAAAPGELVVLAWVLRSSPNGSLKRERKAPTAPPTERIAPTP
jgi:anti-sigma factor RsiW